MTNRVDLGLAALTFSLIAPFTTLIVANEESSPGTYTAGENRALQKLRSLVESELYQTYMRRDEYLIRWIRDQNLDVEKARKKLLASLKWRKENKIDTASQEDLSDIFEACPYSLDGRDKFGRPVITLPVGSCPYRRIITGGRSAELRRYFFHGFEKTIELIARMQSEGIPIVDAVVILDLNGLNWRLAACIRCITIELDLITAYEYHYPRYFHSFTVINAPRIFQILVRIAWPFLSPHSKSIVHVYGRDKNEWQKALLKDISPDQLEPQYGGTKRASRVFSKHVKGGSLKSSSFTQGNRTSTSSCPQDHGQFLQKVFRFDKN